MIITVSSTGTPSLNTDDYYCKQYWYTFTKHCKYKLNTATVLTYFSGHKTEFCLIQNNPKNLDPSYMTDLDLQDCLGRVNLVLKQIYIGMI